MEDQLNNALYRQIYPQIVYSKKTVLIQFIQFALENIVEIFAQVKVNPAHTTI